MLHSVCFKYLINISIIYIRIMRQAKLEVTGHSGGGAGHRWDTSEGVERRDREEKGKDATPGRELRKPDKRDELESILTKEKLQKIKSSKTKTTT